jgi:hypothetical protein
VIIGRTKTDGLADYHAVHEIQVGYKITPHSLRGKPPQPVTVKVDPTIDMKTPPKIWTVLPAKCVSSISTF